MLALVKNDCKVVNTFLRHLQSGSQTKAFLQAISYRAAGGISENNLREAHIILSIANRE